MNNENDLEANDSERILLLEEALIEYVERYGLTERARSALVQGVTVKENNSRIKGAEMPTVSRIPG